MYNSATTLAQTIRSLLAQTYQNWELILIDDGSSDTSVQVARQFSDERIRVYVDGQNRGLAARLNESVRLSRGIYYARMDADDIAYPHRLERQLAYIEQHPNIDLLGTQIIKFDDTGRAIGKPTVPEYHQQIFARAFLDVVPLWHPTFFGRLEWFYCHRYDDNARKTQDQILLLRSYRTSRCANVPDVLVGYRDNGPDLQKMLLTRRVMTPFMVRELLRHGQPLLALRVILRQFAKAGVEIVAVSTGLNYRILRHRAGPVPVEEKARWQDVWELVSEQAEIEKKG